MRGEAPWICDNCGKRRDCDVNHWHVICAIVERGNTPITTILSISKWDEQHAIREGAKHVCGAECRNILVERFFSTGSFEITKKTTVPPPPPNDTMEKGA